MAKLVLVLGNDINTAIDCLPPIITAVAVMTKYLNGVFRVKKVNYSTYAKCYSGCIERKLLNLCVVFQLQAVLHMIRSDSERLMSLPEHDVLYSYALQGRTFCLFFVGK